MTDKLDLYRKHKDEYVKPKKPALVRVGPARYLTIEGRGAPGRGGVRRRGGRGHTNPVVQRDDRPELRRRRLGIAPSWKLR